MSAKKWYQVSHKPSDKRGREWRNLSPLLNILFVPQQSQRYGVDCRIRVLTPTLPDQEECQNHEKTSWCWSSETGERSEVNLINSAKREGIRNYLWNQKWSQVDLTDRKSRRQHWLRNGANRVKTPDKNLPEIKNVDFYVRGWEEAYEGPDKLSLCQQHFSWSHDVLDRQCLGLSIPLMFTFANQAKCLLQGCSDAMANWGIVPLTMSEQGVLSLLHVWQLTWVVL